VAVSRAGPGRGDDYWQRVRALAAAAGYVSGVHDPQFQKLVAAGNPERQDSPTYLRLFKRLEQLEQETVTLRQNKRQA
jgi:hypothetical protein